MSSDAGKKTKDTSTTPASKLTFWGAIGAALIGSITAIVVAIVNHQGSPQFGPVAVSPHPGQTLVSSPQPQPTVMHPYFRHFADFELNGKMGWSEDGKASTVGALKFKNASTLGNCDVELTFQAMDVADQEIGKQERSCHNSPAWPSYGPVSFEAPAIDHIDITINFGRSHERINCPHAQDCKR
jgi:hypothetical protein